jgi:hypothetical protein
VATVRLRQRRYSQEFLHISFSVVCFSLTAVYPCADTTGTVCWLSIGAAKAKAKDRTAHKSAHHSASSGGKMSQSTKESPNVFGFVNRIEAHQSTRPAAGVTSASSGTQRVAVAPKKPTHVSKLF